MTRTKPRPRQKKTVRISLEIMLRAGAFKGIKLQRLTSIPHGKEMRKTQPHAASVRPVSLENIPQTPGNSIPRPKSSSYQQAMIADLLKALEGAQGARRGDPATDGRRAQTDPCQPDRLLRPTSTRVTNRHPAMASVDRARAWPDAPTPAAKEDGCPTGQRSFALSSSR